LRNKAGYWEPFYEVIDNNSDVIQAVTYINANWTDQGWEAFWGDGRVQVNPTIRQIWFDEITLGKWINTTN
jgi:hypothetical protein